MPAESYHRIEKIGEGTYGVVYKALERSTGKIVALKKIKVEDENEGIPPTTLREITILKNIDHPSILKLNDVVFSMNKLYLVFEYLSYDLRSFLDSCFSKGKKIQNPIIKRMAHQLISGVEFCHKRGVLHRDLKPQNILMDSDGNLKLADFGLARIVSIPLRTYTHDIITLWYRPPELLLGSRYYSSQVDIWSLGCIIAELHVFRPIFPGDSEIDQLYKIFKIMGTPTEQSWPKVTKLPNFSVTFPKFKPMDLSLLIQNNTPFLNIIKKMVVLNPSDRINASEILKSEYFSDIKSKVT